LETEKAPRTSFRFAATTAVVLLLVVSIASYEYLQVASLRAANQSVTSDLVSNEAAISSLSSELSGYSASASTAQALSNSSAAVLSSPCLQKLPSSSGTSKIYPNGTNVLTTTYPIFALSPGAVGTLCVAYPNNGNTPNMTDLNYVVRDAENFSIIPNGISFLQNPSALPVGPGNDTMAVYAIQASTSATGFYGLQMLHYCGADPLVVSNNPAAANFSDFPGLLSWFLGYDNDCTWWGPPGTLLGFNGFTTVDLVNYTRSQAIFNETSRSVVSVIESSNVQNVTFKIGIESYSDPLTIVFGSGSSPATSGFGAYSPNHKVESTPGDVCDWNLVDLGVQANSSTPYPSEIPAADVVLDAPALNLQPFSSGVFSYSVLLSNLPQGVFVFSPYLTLSWNSDPHDKTIINFAQYFPINGASGVWNQDVSGTCPLY
jgi:hypothetical protein